MQNFATFDPAGGWYVKPGGLTPHEAKFLTLSSTLQVSSVTTITADMNVVAGPQGLENNIASFKNIKCPTNMDRHEMRVSILNAAQIKPLLS
jgi:hypothetical protein